MQGNHVVRLLMTLVVIMFVLAACAPVASDATRSVPPLPPTNTAQPAPAYALPAQAHLAQALGAPLEHVVIKEIQPTQWPNSCLGVIRTDDVCLEVITPGYRIVFNTPQGDYTYHTDQTGQKFRAAEPSPTATPALVVTPGVIKPGESGIEGMVTISPTCGGPVRPGQDCTAPYQAVITVLDAANKAVVQATSDAQGRFRLPLPPGVYTLRPERPKPGIATAADVTVTVEAGRVTLVEIMYDSGLR